MPDVPNGTYNRNLDFLNTGMNNLVSPELHTQPMPNVPGAQVAPSNKEILSSIFDKVRTESAPWTSSSSINQPVRTPLEQTLRYQSPTYGYDPYNTNLEAQYGDRQSAWTTWGNNIVKFLANTTGAFAQSMVAIPQTIDGILTGDVGKTYNSKLSNSIADLMENLEVSNPTYQSTANQLHPIASWIPFVNGSANNWSTLLNNLGFTAGAIAGSIAQDFVVGSLTGGIGEVPLIGSQMMSAFGKIGRFYTAEKGLSTTAIQSLDRADELLVAINAANKTKKIVDKFRYGLAIGTSAIAEGTFEANQTYRNIEKTLTEDYKNTYNRDPSGTDLEQIKEYARGGGNAGMLANVALLTFTNSQVFGSLFSPTNAAKKVVQSEVMGDADIALSKGSKEIFESTLNNSKSFSLFKTAGKVARPITTSLTEGFEEGSQFVIQRTAEDYYKRKFANKDTDTVDNFFKSLSTGLKEVLTTREGLENVFLGILSGAVIHVGRGALERRKGIDGGKNQVINSAVSLLNSERLSGLFRNTYDEAVVAQSIKSSMDEALAKGDIFEHKNLKFQQLFNFIDSGVRANRFDLRMDQLNMLKDLKPEEFQAMFGINFSDENKKTADAFVDSIIKKAQDIKENIDKVERVFPNPYKKGTNNSFVFDEYKTQLSLDLSEVKDNQRRLAKISHEVALATGADVNEVINLTNDKGVQDTIDKFEKRVKEIEELTKDSEDKESDLYKKQVKEKEFLSKKVGELKDALADDYKGDYSKTAEELLTYYANGKTFNKDRIISSIDAYDILNKAQDGFRLISATDRAVYHYQQLTNKNGYDKFFPAVMAEYQRAEDNFDKTPFLDTEVKPGDANGADVEDVIPEEAPKAAAATKATEAKPAETKKETKDVLVKNEGKTYIVKPNGEVTAVDKNGKEVKGKVSPKVKAEVTKKAQAQRAENKSTDNEAKKADIEKRRQEELNKKQKFTNNRANTSLEQAPVIPFSEIDSEKSGLSFDNSEVKKVKVLEIRGKNAQGQRVGTVLISGTTTEGSPFVEKFEVFFNDDIINDKYDAELAALESNVKTTPNTTKADIERRRQEELTELGQKQLTKGFNSLSEATKPEQVANAIVNIEQNKNQGALLSKEQEQTLSEARAKLKEQGYEIVDYNIVKYGENTIVQAVDFYDNEKDVLTEEQANAIELKINTLEKRGEEVNVDDLPSPVSRTIKPLIKKDGKMVQAAEVNTLIFKSVEQAREAIKKSREAGNKKPNAADKINAKYDAEYVDAVKKGVTELFESTPELANAVYEALGFKEKYKGAEKGDLINELKQITDPYLKEFADLFIQSNVNIPLYYSKGNDYAYVVPDNTLIISKGSTGIIKQKSIIHEVLHGGTSNNLLSNSDFKNRIESIINNIKKSDQQGRITFSYELQSADEFISALADKAFGNYLKQKGLFDEVFTIVKDNIIFEKGFKITPQQKQQAQQLYAQYLSQNPNGSIEGFKAWKAKYDAELAALEENKSKEVQTSTGPVTFIDNTATHETFDSEDVAEIQEGKKEAEKKRKGVKTNSIQMVANPSVLFNKINSVNYQDGQRNNDNLRKVLFSKTPQQIYDGLTATIAESTKGLPHGAYKDFKNIPGIYYTGSHTQIELKFEGQSIGFLSDADRLYFKRGEKYTPLIEIAPEEYEKVTGNEPSTYSDFIQQMTDYKALSEHFYSQFKSGKTEFTNQELKALFDVVTSYGGINYSKSESSSTLLKNLTYKGQKGSAILSFPVAYNKETKQYERTTKPTILNKLELSQNEITDIVTYVANNLKNIQSFDRRYLYLMKMPDGTFRHLVARPSAADEKVLTDVFNELKNLPDTLSKAQLDKINSELSEKLYIADSRNRDERRTDLKLTVDAQGNIYLNVFNKTVDPENPVHKRVKVNEIKQAKDFDGMVRTIDEKIRRVSYETKSIDKLNLSLAKQDFKSGILNDADVTQDQLNNSLSIAAQPEVFKQFSLRVFPLQKGQKATVKPSAPTEAKQEVKPQPKQEPAAVEAIKEVRAEEKKLETPKEEFIGIVRNSLAEIKEPYKSGIAGSNDEDVFNTIVSQYIDNPEAGKNIFGKTVSDALVRLIPAAAEAEKRAFETVQVAADKKSMAKVMETLFSLKSTQAKAVSEIYDRVATTWALRNGKTKEDFYKSITFRKTTPESLEGTEDTIWQNPSIEQEKTAIKEAAKKNGTFRKAPNGRPSLLDEDTWLLTKTKAFKNWFGKSKVLDVNGEPMVMFHGRISDWSIFNKDAGKGLGLFVSPEHEFAQDYMSIKKGRGDVLSLFVKANKPFDYENKADLEELKKTVVNAYYRLTDKEDENSNFYLTDEHNWEILESKPVQDFLKANGYDGYYVKEQGIKNLAVYEADQVKDASGRNATFSTENPDIYYQYSNSAMIANVVKGFDLQKANSFGNLAFQTKNGKATPELATRINKWLSDNGYANTLKFVYEATHGTVNPFINEDNTLFNQGPKGAIRLLGDSQAIIYSLTNPDVSTPLHELAHYWEGQLTDNERAEVLAWAENDTWSRETSEKFARGFEKYLADGEAPTSALQKLFDNFKKWLTDIYKGIVGSDIDVTLNDSMKKIYAAMLGEKYETAIKEEVKTEQEDEKKVEEAQAATPVPTPTATTLITRKDLTISGSNLDLVEIKHNGVLINTIDKFDGAWYDENGDAIGLNKEEAIQSILDKLNAGNTEEEVVPIQETETQQTEPVQQQLEEQAQPEEEHNPEVFTKEDVGSKVMYNGKELTITEVNEGLDKETPFGTVKGTTFVTITDGTKYGEQIVDSNKLTKIAPDVQEEPFDEGLLKDTVIPHDEYSTNYNDFSENSTGPQNEPFTVSTEDEDNLLVDYVGLKVILEHLKQKYNIPYQVVKVDEDWKGKFENGVAVINLTNVTRDTPFHEYLHPFVAVLKVDNPTLYTSLMEEYKALVLENDDLAGEAMSETLKSPLYKGKNKEEIQDEALVNYLGKLGARNFDRTGRFLYDKYHKSGASLARRFFDWFVSVIEGFYGKLNANRKGAERGKRETAKVQFLPVMTLAEFADLTSSNGMPFDFTERKDIITAVKAFQADTVEKTDDQKLIERIKRRLAVLDDTARRRTPSPELLSELIAVRSLLKNYDEFESINQYIYQGVDGLRYASDEFKRISGKLADKETTLTQKDIKQLHRDLDLVRNLLAMYEDVHGLFGRVAQDLDPEVYKTMQMTLAEAKNIADYKIKARSVDLTAEWLFPYIDEVNERIKIKYPNHVITKEQFKNKLYNADEDLTFFQFWLGSVGSNNDPVSAITRTALFDVMEENHLFESKLGEEIKLTYDKFLKTKGLSNEIKGTEEYYKKNFLRKATILQKTEEKDEEGKFKWAYTQKWAMHQPYFYDLYTKDKTDFLETLGEMPDAPSQNSTEAEKALYQSYVDKIFSWEETNGTLSKPADRYKNEAFDNLYNKDEFFTKLYDTYKEGNERYGEEERLQFGIVPQVFNKPSQVQDIKTAEGAVNKVKVTGNKIANFILPKAEETTTAQNDINLDGSMYKRIKTPYVQSIDDDNVSLTLPETIYKFAGAANLVEMMRETEPNVRTLRMVVEGNAMFKMEARKINKVTSDRKTVFDRFLKLPTKKEQASRLNRQLLSWLDDVVYGQEELKDAVQIFGRAVDMNKLGGNWAFLTALNNMAFNVTAGIGNVSIGNIMTLGESLGGKYYGPKDWTHAQGQYFGNFNEFMKDAFNLKKSKITQLGIKYDAIQGEFRDKYGKKFVGNAMQRYATSDTIFIVNHAAEHQIQLVGMLSLMNATKVRTTTGESISLFDAHTINDKGFLRLRDDIIWTAEDEVLFTKRLHGVNKVLNGNYSKFDKVQLQRTWFGKLMLIYRKFMYNAFRARYGRQRFDYEIGDEMEGYYRKFFSKIGSDIKELKFNAMTNFFKRDGWSKDEKYAYNKTMFELSLLIGMGILTIALANASGDDKDKSWLQNTLTLQMLRLRKDIGMYSIFGATDVMQVLQNPSAVILTATRYTNFFTQLVTNPTEVYKRKTGAFDKGDSVLKAKLYKALPIVRQGVNMMQPEEQLQYYKLLNKY